MMVNKMYKGKRPKDLRAEIPDLFNRERVNRLFKHFCEVIL